MRVPFKVPFRLPVGIDSFEKLRKGNYYYVDKTALIEQALEKGSEVTLFTRPRRFGKSLNMSSKAFLKLGRILHYLLVCIFLKILSFVKNIWENILSLQSV